MASTLFSVRSYEANRWVSSDLENINISPALTFITVRTIENYPTASGDAPTDPIVIASCGILFPDDPCLAESAESADGDVYEDFPDDEDKDVQDPQTALKIAQDIREIGNKLFKESKVEAALAKYQSQCVPLLHPWFRTLQRTRQNQSATWTSIPSCPMVHPLNSRVLSMVSLLPSC